jgi:ubiquinone/menaquinone biosynthesis C-methylase UbiE
LKSLEIGAGTGRFAFPLGVKLGLEPAKAMAKLAKKRGIEMILGVAETLPFKNQSFDLVLIITALSFFDHPLQGLEEALRVLKPDGQLLAGIIDRSCLQIRSFESTENGRFSSQENFLSATEVSEWLSELGFENIEICQTIFKKPEHIKEIESPESGHGKGIFVVFSARKSY